MGNGYLAPLNKYIPFSDQLSITRGKNVFNIEVSYEVSYEVSNEVPYEYTHQ